MPRSWQGGAGGAEERCRLQAEKSTRGWKISSRACFFLPEIFSAVLCDLDATSSRPRPHPCGPVLMGYHSCTACDQSASGNPCREQFAKSTLKPEKTQPTCAGPVAGPTRTPRTAPYRQTCWYHVGTRVRKGRCLSLQHSQQRPRGAALPLVKASLSVPLRVQWPPAVPQHRRSRRVWAPGLLGQRMQLCTSACRHARARTHRRRAWGLPLAQAQVATAWNQQRGTARCDWLGLCVQ